MKVKSNSNRNMTFPDADALSSQLFSPSKVPPNANGLIDADSQTGNITKGNTPDWLTVAGIQFAKEEEVESLWLATVVLFADYCNIPSLPVIHRAQYCLEVSV